MKILGVSDIHGNYKALNTIAEYVNIRNDIDALVFCGDIAGDHLHSTIQELSEMQSDDYYRFKAMIEAIRNKKVYYILGNHDVFKINKDDMNYLPNAVNMGIEHVFIPFELICMRFYGTNREGTELDIKAALNNIGDVGEKIFVAHQPPFGCLDGTTIGLHCGSISIKKMINDKKPLIFFCGHIHESYGVRKLGETLVVNCACSYRETRGWVIDSDTLDHEQIIFDM